MNDQSAKNLTQKSRLSFDLSEEQLKALAPMVEATGRVQLLGTLEGSKFSVSFIACNAAFIACNAPFKIETVKS